MIKQRILLIENLVLVFLVSIIMTGCLSLADDITPPPGIEQLSDQQVASTPTLQPIASIPPTEGSPTVSPAGVGLVNVTVLDRTEGSLFEDNPEVFLEGYDQFTLAFEATLPVTEEGFIQFSDIPLPEGRVYFASIPYGGAVYHSQIVVVEGEPAELELQVEIYNTTTDQSALIMDRVHVLMEFNQPDQVDVVEIFILSNNGDSTIVPDSPGEISIEFPLPAEAFGISFEDGNLGQRFLSTDEGFGDTVSVPPGSEIYPVTVYYSLPYQESQLEFRQRFEFPASAVIVMLPVSDVIVQGANLEDLGVQALPNGEVKVYSASGFNENDLLEFRIFGKPAADMPETVGSNEPVSGPIRLNDMIIYGAGGAGTLLLAYGIWLLIRNRQQNIPGHLDDTPQGSREDILDSIIALDDLYANGEINENAYQDKRKQLKEKLKLFSEG